MALEVSSDLEHKFELSIRLKKLNLALEIASRSDSEAKWRQLSDLALAEWKVLLFFLPSSAPRFDPFSTKMDIAEESLKKANDLSGLLLFYISTSNADGIRELALVAGIFPHIDS